MKKQAYLAFLLCAFPVLAAEPEAPTLTVFVRENNPSGAPMVGVQIIAPGASPGATGSTGKKTLVFPEHRVGDTLELEVYKEGYEVVNDLQRTVTLPRFPKKAQELNLFVCKPAHCLVERLSFYRLSVEPLKVEIEERFQRKRLELEAQRRANSEALARVQGERDQALARVDQLIEELAQLKSGEGLALYRRAMQLVSESKLDEALAELDASKLLEERANARAKLEDVADGFVLRGQLLALRFQFDEAEEAYQQAVETAPESLAAGFAFAFFLDQQKRFAKAVLEYERCLSLARERADSALVAAILNNLGILHRDQNRMDDAQGAFEEAIRSYRELSAMKPEAYLPYLATTINNFGILLSKQNRTNDARGAYEEALLIYRELSAKNREVYLPDVAMTLNNLGILHRDQNRMDDAQGAFEEALRIYRELSAKNREVYQFYVATTLHNLGALHSDQRRNDAARGTVDEALGVYRELSARNPEVYLPYLATTLNSLGALHRDQNRNDAARAAYEEALRVRRELAVKNPDVYLPDLAMSLNNLGALYSDQNRNDAARGFYQEALRIWRELAVKNPEVYLPDLAMSLNNLGMLHRDQNRIDAARGSYEEALRIRRELAARNPEQFLPPLVQSLEGLGRLELKSSNSEAGSSLFAEALARRKHMASLGLPGSQSSMARTAGVLAMLYALDGRAEEAMTAAQEALAMIDGLEAPEREVLGDMVSRLREILAQEKPNLE